MGRCTRKGLSLRLLPVILLSTIAFFSGSTLQVRAAFADQAYAVRAGDLLITLNSAASGARLSSIKDAATEVEFLAADGTPLFDITLKAAHGKDVHHLRADVGWSVTHVSHTRRAVRIRWERPADTALGQIAVIVEMTPDPKQNAIRWTLQIEPVSPDWIVWEVIFPQFCVKKPGVGAALLYETGAGVVNPRAWDEPFTFDGYYPDGATMQFMAVYNAAEKPSGLYFGMHDPHGSMKRIYIKSDPAKQSLLTQYRIYAPNRILGNGFELSGSAVTQLFRGDWFDASMIYKEWVKREALWWPKLGKDGRTDTAQDYKELCAWFSQWGTTSAEVLQTAKGFQEFLGLPVGLHWYTWHQIPYDNDYPHFLPAKAGFGEAVAEMQAQGVYATPHINGRLWDTRDRGLEDDEFTRLARPSAVIDDSGEVEIETTGAKESDKTSVRAAVMCPGTEFWQKTVADLAGELFAAYGVRGVYLDQVVAGYAIPCMAANHNHAPGGGSWWSDGYNAMLASIRSAMPKGSFLTSECNAEPYLNGFDGYLTWHWERNGQVPSFPAVYGGAIQMFGREYSVNRDTEQSFAMKCGQQLVFGEQIGWLRTDWFKDHTRSLDFMKKAIQARHQFRRYFYAGEMMRPPKPNSEMPTVTADWNFCGEKRIVTTDAVLAGMWRLAKEKKIVVLLVNVSETPVDAVYEFKAGDLKIKTKKMRCEVTRNLEVISEKAVVSSPCFSLALGPRDIAAIEFSW
jgi:hypothetical protein